MEAMTIKFSSNPKSKEERAARVRDNQRRHRARVKSHIEELEEQLKETQKKLEEALRRNEDLEKRNEELAREVNALRTQAKTPPEAECERGRIKDDLTRDASLLLALGEEHLAPLRPVASPSIRPVRDPGAIISWEGSLPSVSKTPATLEDDNCSSSKPTNPVSSLSSASISSSYGSSLTTTPNTSASSCCQTPETSPALLPVGPPFQTVLISSEPFSFPTSNLFAPRPFLPPSAPVVSSSASQTPSALLLPSPATAATTSSSPDSDSKALEQDCPHLPPPQPGESTIHCKTAYRIISEQNFRGMDVETIHNWLGPGFRRAIIAGDGCRVDSQLVMRVLDVVSGE